MSDQFFKGIIYNTAEHVDEQLEADDKETLEQAVKG